MQSLPIPLTRECVLIGGGHAHALVLRRWGMRPLPGARLTVINPAPSAPYTGMLPGHVAGHYDRDALQIDLVRLARHAGARLILGAATGIDRARRRIQITGHVEIAYDIASIDIGITGAMPEIPGFAEHAIAAKPLGAFADRWDAHLARNRGGPIAVIGGGVGGVELALAMAHARGTGAGVTVIEAERALSGVAPRAAALLHRRLAQAGIDLCEMARIAAITAGGVTLDGGRQIPATFVVGAAGARPHGWLSQIGLHLTEGFATVTETLQSTSDPAIFAVGDCAHLGHAPRPKAGVFSVRQAPVLYDNLRAALTGGRMRAYRPQKRFLKLISLGSRDAVAENFGLGLGHPALWRLKDRIDGRFMARLNDLRPMAAPRLAGPRAHGVDAARGEAPPCGGCGAKVGRGTLGGVLAGLAKDADRPAHNLGDDAAILRTGGAVQVFTTDHLRALTADPGMMARIAAIHALGDIWAMGAKPQAALASITLPPLSDRMQGEWLAEIMAEAGAVLRAAGAEIAGGHTATGAELSIGFSLTGLCDAAPITLKGARPGDALILTKPLGSGTIMAAEMRLAAPGPVVAAAYEVMARSQGAAAALLAPNVHAMTDVTGFGLAGHLAGILEASNCAAVIAADAVPLIKGAAALAAAGIRSTLYPANRADLAGIETLGEDPVARLMFDPQTAGGLLAAVPAKSAEALCRKLRAGGEQAAIIGKITAGPPRLSFG